MSFPLAWDETYIINLDRDTRRMALMHRQAVEHGLTYQRVPAVDGMRVADLEHVTPLCRHLCTPSMIGCALSHMAVWKRVAEAGHACALVMEDDAQLVPGFVEGAHRALRDVPGDWDVLLLGCFFLCDRERRYSWPLQLARWVLPVHDDPRSWGSVFVPELFGGAHCYLVSLRGARKLLRLLPRVAYHIDMCMNRPDVRLYAVSPDLAFQRDMGDSGMASYTFPRTLLPLLSRVRDSKGISAAYYMTAPLGQVGGLVLNGWALLFVLLGTQRSRLAPYVAAFLALELAVGGRVGAAVAAYALGWAVAAVAAAAK